MEEVTRAGLVGLASSLALAVNIIAFADGYRFAFLMPHEQREREGILKKIAE